MQVQSAPQVQLLRMPDVCRRLAVGRSTFYRLLETGAFPPGVRIAERAIAWPEHEVQAYIEAKMTERRGAA